MNKEKLKRRSQFIAVLSRYFNDYLPSRRSEKTITYYRVVMTRFLKHIAGRGAMRLDELSFEDITRDSVEGFIRTLHEDEKLSASTCNNYLSVIRAFMKYASTKCISANSPEIMLVEKIREPKTMVVRHLEMEAVRAILSAVDTCSFEGARDHLFIRLMFDTAARLSEMLDLRIQDIVLARGHSYAIIENGKGGKKRKVPITDRVAEEVSAYVNAYHRNSTPSDFLFYRKSKDRHVQLSKMLVGRHLKRYAETARIACSAVPKNVTCHMLRHSRAMQLYRKGMSLAMIGQLLGHANPETTLIYAYADTEVKRNAISKASEGIMKGFPSHAKHEAYDENAILISMGLKD